VAHPRRHWVRPTLSSFSHLALLAFAANDQKRKALALGRDRHVDVACPLTGTWSVIDGSKGQYRVEETLFGQDATATGTSDKVSGSLTIAGRRWSSSWN